MLWLRVARRTRDSSIPRPLQWLLVYPIGLAVVVTFGWVVGNAGGSPTAPNHDGPAVAVALAIGYTVAMAVIVAKYRHDR